MLACSGVSGSCLVALAAVSPVASLVAQVGPAQPSSSPSPAQLVASQPWPAQVSPVGWPCSQLASWPSLVADCCSPSSLVAVVAVGQLASVAWPSSVGLWQPCSLGSVSSGLAVVAPVNPLGLPSWLALAVSLAWFGQLAVGLVGRLVGS